MTDECKKLQYMFYVAIGLCLIQSGYLFWISYETGGNSDWDELTLTRRAIENYDVVIEYIDAGQYEEAEVLADATSTYLWYLRNSKKSRTEFYDELEFYDITFFIGCVEDSNDAQEIPYIKEQIIRIQQKLCPRSDLSREWWDKEYPEWADEAETRC